MEHLNASLSKARYFVCLDSDGCVLDTMETKHRTAFVPALISMYELDHIAGLVEEVWCFINLYSRERGINRFLGLVRTFEELHRHPVLSRFPGVLAAILPDIRPIKAWLERSNSHSNDSLKLEINRLIQLRDHGDVGSVMRGELDDWIYELDRCLTWSQQVNMFARQQISSAEAFGNVYNFLRMIRPEGNPSFLSAMDQADRETSMVVVSQSPRQLLDTQWNTAGFARYVDVIHGQEDGPKAQILKSYKDAGFNGPMLMVGDAPGDYEAARDAGAWFFPIIPRREAESWSRLAYEGWPLFAAGCYNREYQNRLLDEFFHSLPTTAPWEEPVLRRVS